MEKYIKIFECFGVDFSDYEEGDQAIGRCPFCDRKNHFYVNKTTGLWDCKRCGETGNHLTFLKQYSKMIYENTTTSEYKTLAKKRGLPVKALRDWRLGWDGECWLLPVLSQKKTCRDIRRWNPKTKIMKSTPGCKVQLYGWYKASKLPPNGTIYICEGEWDAIALSWLLARAGMANTAAVGSPGAMTFKDDWVEQLARRNVVLCYDNDIPGEQGSVKVYHKLVDVVKSIGVIQWPGQYAKGYDIGDFIKDRIKASVSIKKILKELKKLIVDPDELDMYISEDDKIQEQEDEILENPPTFEETLEVFEKWADMTPDLVDALKVSLAVVLSTKMSGDPVWMYLVGPAGCGKTMLLLSLEKNKRCIFRSSITAHTLVSGFQRSPDPSLLPKLHKKCCIWKDFTEVLERKDKDEIYSTLRGAFDGSVAKAYGNGVERNYKSLHFSMLAGTTPAVHGDRKAMLGERFLKFEIFEDIEADASDQIRAAMADVGKEEKMMHEFRTAVAAFLSRETNTPKLPEWAEERIVALAQITSKLRSVVEREQFGDRDPLYYPSTEVGTRPAKQFKKLIKFVALVNGHKKVQYEDIELIEKIAFHTSRKMYMKILQVIQSRGGEATVSEICEHTRLNWHVISRQLEDLYILRILLKIPGKGKKRWRIEKHIHSLFEKAKIGQRPKEQGKLMCKRKIR